MPFKIIPREAWQALPAKSSEPLKIPVKSLLIMDTQSADCDSVESCRKIVQELQRQYMEEKGFDDIPWSYLIGGDGSIFEGRGWKVNPIKTDLSNKRMKENDGKSIDVAYIGNFQNTVYGKHFKGIYPPNKAINANEDLYRFLDRKHVLDMTTCDMTDFLIDYQRLEVD